MFASRSPTHQETHSEVICMSLEHGRVLNTGQAATYVGLAPSTMAKLRLSGLGPSYSKLMRRVVYRPADLDAWMALHQRQSTSARDDFIGDDYRPTLAERLRAHRGDRPED